MTLLGSITAKNHSAHGYGDIDAQIAVVSKELGDGGVKHQAVGVHDGRAHPLVDRPETIKVSTNRFTIFYLGVASQVRRRL